MEEKIVVNQQYPEWIQAILAKGLGQKETCSEIMSKGMGLGMSLNEIFQFIIAIYGISIAFGLFGALGNGNGFGGLFGGNNTAKNVAIAEGVENKIDQRICEIQTAMAANDARQAAYQKCDEEYRALKNQEALLAAIANIAEVNKNSTAEVVAQLKSDRAADMGIAMKNEIDSLKAQLENQKFVCLQEEVKDIENMIKGLYGRSNCNCGCNNPQVVYAPKNC